MSDKQIHPTDSSTAQTSASPSERSSAERGSSTRVTPPLHARPQSTVQPAASAEQPKKRSLFQRKRSQSNPSESSKSSAAASSQSSAESKPNKTSNETAQSPRKGFFSRFKRSGSDSEATPSENHSPSPAEEQVSNHAHLQSPASDGEVIQDSNPADKANSNEFVKTAEESHPQQTDVTAERKPDAAPALIDPTTEEGSDSDVAEEENSTEKRSSALLKRVPKSVAIGAAVLIAGGAIAYFNLAQRTPRSVSLAGTQLVPQSAIATVTLTTDELTWTKLRQFGTEESQEQLDGLLTQLKDDLLTNNGLQYKQDIKPWIGDRITLAVLPPDTDSPSADGSNVNPQQPLVLVIPIDDALKAKSILEEQPALESSNPSRKYRGIDINTLDLSSGDTLQTAVIGTDWLLVSNAQSGIERAIDTHRGQRSLLDKAGYRKAASGLLASPQPGTDFAQVYLSIEGITNALRPPEGITNAPAGSLVPLQGSDGIVGTVRIENQGIRILGTSWLTPQNDWAYESLSNQASAMPQRLPDDTLVAMTGGNLQQFWQGFSEGQTSPPFFPDPQNLKANLLTQTGLDIDEDILPWAAGEFAFALLPPSETPAAPDADPEAEPEATDGDAPLPETETSLIQNAPIVLMVQTNDRTMAESVWSQIDDVMVSRYRFEVQTNETEGGSITRWISPFQGVQFSHGWLPGDVTFFAIGDGGAEAITPRPDLPLAANRQFQTLTDQAPEDNYGHFYLDLEEINSSQGLFPVPQLPEEGPTAAIQAIGLTTTVGDRTMNYDLYVQLLKGDRPGPL